MRYYGEEALGLVETLGLVPALEAADKMLKAADVELISYENVGSTLVTIMVKGDVAFLCRGRRRSRSRDRKADSKECNAKTDPCRWRDRFGTRY